MSELIFESPIVSGEPFEFYATVKAGGVAIDLTNATALFVGREDVESEDTLFSYTQADTDTDSVSGFVTNVIEFGSFDVEVDGVSANYQVRVTLPHTKTQEMRAASYESIRVGLKIIPVGMAPIQSIPDARLNLCRSVAS